MRAPIAQSDLPVPQQITVSPFDQQTIEQLDRLFQRLVRDHTDAGYASIAVWQPAGGYWESSFSRGEPASEVFWWASVGKLVTSAIILQLVDEGVLNLEETIDAWFPEYPNARFITIRHLLSHTGGVFSFNTDKKLNKMRGAKAVDLLIKTSARQGADFCPGSNWNYSNTGYVMLGVIAERITQQSLRELTQVRLAHPLSLSSLQIIEAQDDPALIVPPSGEAPPSIEEIASIYGAGAISANTSDILSLLAARLTGEATSTWARNESFDGLYQMFQPGQYYGLGVMVIDVPDPEFPTVWLGHSGGSPNAKALDIYDTERATFLSLVLNTQAPAEAIANAVLKEID